MTIKEWEKTLGPWIEKDVNLVVNHLKKGDVYFDVGANTGLFTQMVIKKLGGDYNFFNKIVLFEPIKKYYDECVTKFKKHKNVQVEQIALSDNDNNKIIYVSHINYGYNKIYREGMEIQPHDKYVIKCTTFTEWIKNQNCPKVDFIKIDAEGHDSNIVNGMFEWLATTENRPKILFECAWYGVEELDVIEKLVNEYGYVQITENLEYNNALLVHLNDY